MPKTRRARRRLTALPPPCAPLYSSSKAEGGAGENIRPDGFPCFRTVANAFLRKAASTSAAEHFARSRGAIAGTSEKQPAFITMFMGVMNLCGSSKTQRPRPRHRRDTRVRRCALRLEHHNHQGEHQRRQAEHDAAVRRDAHGQRKEERRRIEHQ